MNSANSETFLPLEPTATRLGVPTAWLRAETQAGRIPHIKAGKRLLFNIALVEQVLLGRAASQSEVSRKRDGRLGFEPPIESHDKSSQREADNEG